MRHHRFDSIGQAGIGQDLQDLKEGHAGPRHYHRHCAAASQRAASLLMLLQPNAGLIPGLLPCSSTCPPHYHDRGTRGWLEVGDEVESEGYGTCKAGRQAVQPNDN